MPAPEGPEEALDQLLRQIITGFFLLADGQGDISKWSDPAELLFGLDADDALGKPFFQTLIRDPLPAEGEGWKGFLEMGEEPQVRARVEMESFHEKVGRFPLEAVFIPVKLDEGFDFSLFLEDLSFELPIDLMLLRMRQQHPVVIRALRASLDENPQIWEGWRTAGTLIAFRPLVETPWLEEALAIREEEARRAAEEAASRIAAYEAPSVQGEDVRDLEDAAAIVDKLKWASERIEDFEERSRVFDKTAADAASAKARAEAAERLVAEAQEQLTQALTRAGTERSSEAEAERLELIARLERVERLAQETQEATAAQRQTAENAHRLAAEAERSRELVAQRLAALEGQIGEAADAGRVAAAEQARAEAFAAVEVAREELQARLEALERARSEGNQEAAQHAREKLEDRLEALERSREAEARFVREELERVRAQAAEVAALREQVIELGRPREDGRLREELNQVRARADEIVTVASEVRRLQGPVADIAGLRAQVEKLESALAQVAEQRARAEAAETGLAELRGEVETARARAEEALATRTDAAGIEALREELASVRDRAQQADALRADLDALGQRLEAAATREVPLSPEDRARLETAEREAEEARAGLEAVRHQSDDLRAQAATLREEAGRLQAQLHALREGDGQARHDLDGLRREHDDLRAALQEAKGERDEIRAQLREALRTAEEARAAASERPSPTPATTMTESGVRRLQQTRDAYMGLRRDTDALRARMDELATLAESAERRAEEARAEAAAARNEGIETRDEAREAQRAARETGDRVDLVDRGAANVLTEIQAQAALVEELSTIARAARQAAAESQATVERVEAELRTQTGEETGRLRDELAALRQRVESADDADLREALGSLRAELDGGRERLEQLKSELVSETPAFRAELEELRERVESADPAGPLAELRQAIGELRERLGDLAPAEELKAEFAELWKRVDEVAESSTLREEIGELRQRLEDRTELAALREDLDELRSRPEPVIPELPEFPEIDPAVLAAAQELPVLREAVKALQEAGFSERLGELHGELKASRHDNSESRLVIEQRMSELAAEVVTARTEAEQARQTVDALREELSTLREYAAAVRAETGAATQTATAARTAVNASDRKFEKLKAEVAGMMATVETWKAEIKEARKAAVAARKDAELAKSAAEKVGAANEANAERFTEVWREILNLKPAEGTANGASGVRKAPANPAFPTVKEEPPPEREPRAGFDDQATPMAQIGLNGKFTELNPAFSRLVGYKEHEFARATWPSVHDREIYDEQKANLAELIAGKRERVKVHSTYMHGAGLMVPVFGELTLVKDGQGKPTHLLLVAEDRQNPVA